MFISIMFIPLYLSVGDLIGEVLYKNSLSGALLQSSAICILPITMCNLTGSVLDSLNLEVKALKNYLIGSTILLVSLLTFTTFIGINSIIISFFLSMSAISCLNLLTLKKASIKLNFNVLKTTLYYLFIIIPSSIIGYFISGIMQHFFTAFFSGLIAGGISILLTVLLVKTFNIYDLNQIKYMILKRHKHS